MVTKYDEGCLLVHLFNDVVDDFFAVLEFPLNFRMLGIVGVPGRVDSDDMDKHQGKIGPRI